MIGDLYDEFKDIAKRIILPIGTCILVVVILLSSFLHWGFISSILDLISGKSLLFIVYVAALVIVLDVKVDVGDSYCYYNVDIKKMPFAYKLTVIWGVLLIAMGIGAINISNRYRKHYAFECTTFLVDHSSKVYHLDWDNDCEDAKSASHLEKLKGYQIDDSYTICVGCEEWAEYAEDVYNSEKYYRR